MAVTAGFGQIYHYSADRGIAAKSYDGIELGDEPRGSLVVELRRLGKDAHDAQSTAAVVALETARQQT